MTDIEQLRFGFCSLVMQAKGSLISNFVAWLDLKVAEYKVYGHMILTEENETESDAWQYTSDTDPSHWPRNLPDNYPSNHGEQAASGVQQIPSFNKRPAPYGMPSKRGRSQGNRQRTSNIIKNAIARSNKQTFGSNAMSSHSNPKLMGPSTGMSASLGNNQNSFVKQEPISSIPKNTTSQFAPHQMSASLSVKQESEVYDVERYGEGDSTMASEVWQGSQSQLLEQNTAAAAALPRPSQKIPKPSTPRSNAGPMSSGRVGPPQKIETNISSSNQSALNQLLKSHTIQTETGFVCGICGKTGKWVHNVRRHIRAEHFGVRYECPHCEETFKWQSDIQNHLFKFHNMTKKV